MDHSISSDDVQRSCVHDPCYQGHLPLATLRLHQSQVLFCLRGTPALIDTELKIMKFYSNIGADEMLFSEKDLEKSMDKIETINFHQVMHNLNSPILHSSIPGGGCEWNQVLVLQCWSCAGCGDVHDRDCWGEDFLHW